MRLFPILEDEFGELDDDHRPFVALCQTVEPLFPHGEFAWCGNGRPPVPRLWLLRAFLAKALWNFPTTRALIEELGVRPKMRRRRKKTRRTFRGPRQPKRSRIEPHCERDAGAAACPERIWKRPQMPVAAPFARRKTTRAGRSGANAPQEAASPPPFHPARRGFARAS